MERLLDPTEKAKFVDRPGTSTSTVTKPDEPTKSQPPSSSGVVPPSEHAGLTQMQKEELMNVFREDIHAGRPVKASQVRERIKVIKILSVLTTSDQRMKSVQNYLNYEARKYALSQSQGSSPPASVAPADDKVSSWLDKYDEPSTRTTSAKRTEWSADDVAMLAKALKKYIYFPSTEKIREILASDSDIQALLDREGWSSVYNKIKNMYCTKK